MESPHPAPPPSGEKKASYQNQRSFPCKCNSSDGCRYRRPQTNTQTCTWTAPWLASRGFSEHQLLPLRVILHLCAEQQMPVKPGHWRYQPTLASHSPCLHSSPRCFSSHHWRQLGQNLPPRYKSGLERWTFYLTLPLWACSEHHALSLSLFLCLLFENYFFNLSESPTVLN